MRQIGRWIADALHHRTEPDRLARIRKQVLEMANIFPLYPERRARALATIKA
jgi:glycine/serine hydroxymethyltransferase